MTRNSPLHSTEVSTSLDAWRANIARSFVPMEVSPTPDTPEHFSATVERTRLGFISLSLVTGDAHVARRTEENILRHPSDLLKVSYQITGAVWIEQDGRQSLITPGSLSIYDTGRPYILSFPGSSESVVVQIPRSELPIEPALLAGITARTLRGPAALNAALLTILRGVLHGDETSGPAGDYHLSRSIAELTMSIVLSETASTHLSDSARDAQLASLKLYAQAHLSNPKLSIEDAARANYISVRTAQRLFQREEVSFAGWLRTQRLTRAHHRVVTTDHPITDIAHESGFASATHFSRAFRDQYGVSARELRRHSVSADTPA